MICNNCGNDLPDGSRKCIYCGADLDKDIGKEKQSKGLITALITIIAVSLGAWILVSNNYCSDKEAVTDTAVSTELLVDDNRVISQSEDPFTEQSGGSAAEHSGEAVSVQTTETTVEKEDEQKTDNSPVDENSTVLEEPAPFYGIWCGAYKVRESAELFASSMKEKGLPSEVFVTTDWSNLNKDKWYVISAGTYDTKESADNMLSKVQNHYSNAYIKYSGEWIGK